MLFFRYFNEYAEQMQIYAIKLKILKGLNTSQRYQCRKSLDRFQMPQIQTESWRKAESTFGHGRCVCSEDSEDENILTELSCSIKNDTIFVA